MKYRMFNAYCECNIWPVLGNDQDRLRSCGKCHKVPIIREEIAPLIECTACHGDVEHATLEEPCSVCGFEIFECDSYVVSPDGTEVAHSTDCSW